MKMKKCLGNITVAKVFVIYIIVILQAYLAGYCYIEGEYFATGFVAVCSVLTFLIGKAARGTLR